MKVSTDITKRLDGIMFGFYTPEEIRKMSVVEVKGLSAFDQFGSPLKEGLYDPRMGVSPYERFSKCVTCGQDEESCPGHIGHLELVVPVYNVFLVRYLHKLLRTKCLFCHKIKATETRTKHFKIMFTLLKFGMLAEYEQYRRLCEIRVPNKYKQGIPKTAKPQEPKKERRKDSQSTRRPSETSEGTMNEEKLPVKEDTALKEILCDLEAYASQERAKIAAMIDIRKNPERFSEGIEWNASISQKFQ